MKSTVELIKEKLAANSKKKQMLILSREEFESFIDEISPTPTELSTVQFRPFAIYKEFWFYMTRDILDNRKQCIAFFYAKPDEVKEYLESKYPDIKLEESILVRVC